MEYNAFSLTEIFVFFRYKSFPVFLGLLVLAVGVSSFWRYLSDNKPYQRYASLAVLVLLLKQLAYFFLTRHLVFNYTLRRYSFTAFHFALIEGVSAFLLFVFLGFALERKKKSNFLLVHKPWHIRSYGNSVLFSLPE